MKRLLLIIACCIFAAGLLAVPVAAADKAAVEKELIPDTPLWKDPQLIALLKELAKYFAFGVIAWLTWTKLLKPVFERLARMVPPP